MIGLLLCPAEGWGTGDYAVELLGEPLDLAPSATASLGTTLIVGVNLLAGRYVVNISRERFAQYSELVLGLVACFLC